MNVFEKNFEIISQFGVLLQVDPLYILFPLESPFQLIHTSKCRIVIELFGGGGEEGGEKRTLIIVDRMSAFDVFAR